MLGLLSTILSIALGAMPYIALAVGIVGLVLSVRARQTESTSTLASAGFVLSIIGVVISGIELMVWVTCVGTIWSLANTATHYAASGVRDAIRDAIFF